MDGFPNGSPLRKTNLMRRTHGLKSSLASTSSLLTSFFSLHLHLCVSEPINPCWVFFPPLLYATKEFFSVLAKFPVCLTLSNSLSKTKSLPPI